MKGSLRELFHGLVYSPNVHNNQGWARLNLCVHSSIWISCVGVRIQVIGSSSALFLGTLAGSLMRSRVARTWLGMLASKSGNFRCATTPIPEFILWIGGLYGTWILSWKVGVVSWDNYLERQEPNVNKIVTLILRIYRFLSLWQSDPFMLLDASGMALIFICSLHPCSLNGFTPTGHRAKIWLWPFEKHMISVFQSLAHPKIWRSGYDARNCHIPFLSAWIQALALFWFQFLVRHRLAGSSR